MSGRGKDNWKLEANRRVAGICGGFVRNTPSFEALERALEKAQTRRAHGFQVSSTKSDPVTHNREMPYWSQEFALTKKLTPLSRKWLGACDRVNCSDGWLIQQFVILVTLSPGASFMRGTRSFLRLVSIFAVGVSLNCSTDRVPTGPVFEQTTAPSHVRGLLGNGLLSGLLSCSPLPYASTTDTIGPNGGYIAVGPHSLYVPPGALTQPVAITAEAPSDNVNSVRLTPEGLTFEPGKPARLSLSYANCSLLGQLLPKRIAYTSDELDILSLLPSLDDFLRQRVRAPLEHFSRYAISW